MGSMIEFARPDGGRTKGYLATAGHGRPGVVVIQEWWGLNDQIRGAARHLKNQSGKMVVMGYCMGGALTISAGVHVPEFAAGVCFYGIPPQEFANPAQIRVPLQGHFANKDDWCTPAAVDELEKVLKGAGVKHEIYRYDAAHAFANERSAAYDVACANLAWDRMSAFLKALIA
jgi:carboxymethylenebutenolidase